MRQSTSCGIVALTKFMILGTSMSGKTTVRRQIQLLYGLEFTNSEREKFRKLILDNLRSASTLIYFRIDTSGIQLSAVVREVCHTPTFFPSWADFQYQKLAALTPLHAVNSCVWSHATVARYAEAFRYLLSIPAVCRLMHSEDWHGINGNIDL